MGVMMPKAPAKRKTKKNGKRKKKIPTTPKIENMDPAVLDAVKKTKEIEFVTKEIEQNRAAAHRRMERFYDRVNRGG